MLSNDAERRVRERILVVDDELLIRNVIATRLQWRGYNVILATNGEEAVASFQREPMDLVVLDLMLPRLNGFGVLRAVRSSSDVPVLMLSACDRLEARIRCLLRRARLSTPNPTCRGSATRPTETQISGLTLHYGTRQVFRGIKRIKLTSMEFSLLELLVSQAGQPVPRLKIMETIWGYVPERHADTRVVDVHVARLRHKLEQDPKHPELILTARSLGYQFQRLPELAA
jgi:OmpR family response regulator RpaB